MLLRQRDAQAEARGTMQMALRRAMADWHLHRRLRQCRVKRGALLEYREGSRVRRRRWPLPRPKLRRDGPRVARPRVDGPASAARLLSGGASAGRRRGAAAYVGGLRDRRRRGPVIWSRAVAVRSDSGSTCHRHRHRRRDATARGARARHRRLPALGTALPGVRRVGPVYEPDPATRRARGAARRANATSSRRRPRHATSPWRTTLDGAHADLRPAGGTSSTARRARTPLCPRGFRGGSTRSRRRKSGTRSIVEESDARRRGASMARRAVADARARRFCSASAPCSTHVGNWPSAPAQPT